MDAGTSAPGRLVMNNAEIAQMLYEFAELMDLKGDLFKRNAYRRAAQSVEALDQEVQEYIEGGKLEDIPGVGESIAKKIGEIVSTGKSADLEKLRQEFPAGLVQLMSVPDVGPKSVIRLRKELGVNSLQELKEAALAHRIRDLKGFGEKSEENILKGIALVEKQSGRMPLGHAYPIARDIAEYLRTKGHSHTVSVAGSLRRMRETVGDIDILAGSDNPEKVMELFVSHPLVASIISKGGTRASVRLDDGTQVDLRVVSPESYGAALQYFTGSKEHNVKMRRIAIQKGYKLNEYGVFHKDDDTPVAGSDEDGIYRLLGMDPMPPEMREDRGEIEAALEHRLPDLVRMENIKGDFHVHTVMSDGMATMREVAEEAIRRGYQYIGVTDHSQSLHIAGGLSVDDLLASVQEARQLSEELDFPVLRGAEVDILEDGSLDYPDDVLSQLDYVIGSVHSRFKMDKEQMTQRVLTALSNEELNVLGHPTGRLIGKRPGYDIDLDKVMDEARKKGVLLELNGFPDRLDLNDLNCRKAKERGVMLSIGTDAHNLKQMDNMELAVGTARRAWLEARDLLNTFGIDKVRKVFSR